LLREDAIVSEVLQLAGGLSAAGAASVAILIGDRRVRAIAMLAALALAAALVAGEAWHGQLRELREEPAMLAAGLALGLAAIGGLAALGARFETLIPLALIAALPFRIPIETGGESYNLLVPLYIVLGAAVVLEAWRSRSGGDLTRPNGFARWLGYALAASLVLYAAQAIYSSDVSRAVQNVGFFLVPFALMFVLLRDAKWTPRLLLWALVVVLAEAVCFAVIGIVQHEVREIFWNDKVMRSNEFDVYFRVNSLFWDPNIYGRYLALSILVGTSALLWAKEMRRFALGAAAIAVAFAGLVFGYSQTSFMTLLAGLVVLSALRWSLRWTLVGGAAALLAAAAFVVVSPDTLTVDSGAGGELEQTTSGRTRLASGGLDLARERPATGFGSGSFAVEFEERNELPNDEAAVSHTEPVTVLAEQGAIGLLLYLALLVASGLVLFAGLWRLAPGLGGPPPGAGKASSALIAARVAVATAFAGMLVHTVGYAGFLTDPLTWALLAIGAALASAAVRDG
jgi:O-antigen ligase